MHDQLPTIDEVEHAISRLAAGLQVVETESIAVAAASRRVLAEPLVADRDSPPSDVSAMDGYAIRLDDLGLRTMPVPQTAVAGSPPLVLEPHTAIKIFTGAPVPVGADTIIVREQTEESTARVHLQSSSESVKRGQHIRRQGENITAGKVVLPAGQAVTPTVLAAVATFSPALIRVFRPVRVAVVTTGDELLPAGAPAEAWQIRDSNGPLLESWLNALGWVHVVSRTQVPDDFHAICRHLGKQLEECDALLVTGGMSAGDTDHVPAAVRELGGNTIFHRLGIRPGKPVFGAHVGGKLVLGLPGNPVSVAVTSRVFGSPLLRRLGGVQTFVPSPLVELHQPDDKQLHLIWYRLVDVDIHGHVRLVSGLGSGDLVTLARSAGFVRVPAGARGGGPWPFTAW
jgi:molybdopterin molybdotransferase